MSEATPVDDALEGLSELAGCDLRLAKRFCARIEALPEDADDKAMALARSYQRMARSYRQTIVVQARLRREAKAEARADADEIRAARPGRIANLKAAIQAQVRPRIWTDEREEELCEDLDALVDDLLADAAERPDFLDVSRETHVAAILRILDLEDLDLRAAQARAAAHLNAEPDDNARNEADPAPPSGGAPEPIRSNGRLAAPMEVTDWVDDPDTS